MKAKKTQQWLLLLACLILQFPGMLGHPVHAHGSVVDDGDGCIIRMDFYSAHFTVFQPATRAHREYCEDLPDVAESVFVLEYLHNSLRDVPIDFRIIRNTTALGRFVRWPDVEAMGDLSELTVFFQRTPAQPDGVLTVLHEFRERGDYIGIVSAPHPTQDKMYHAVFPFSVGRTSAPAWLWPLSAIVIFAVAIKAGRRRARRHP